MPTGMRTQCPRNELGTQGAGGNTRRINELIVSLQRRLRVTSVVITHDMASALAVSDRIALLQDRRIGLVVERATAEQDPPPELRAFVRGDLIEPSEEVVAP